MKTRTEMIQYNGMKAGSAYKNAEEQRTCSSAFTSGIRILNLIEGEVRSVMGGMIAGKYQNRTFFRGMTSMVVLALSLACCLTMAGIADAATAGPNNPSSASNNNSIGSRSWSSVTNVYSSNNSNASATSLTSSTSSNYLVATGFGFSIPVGSTINGIRVTIERRDGGVSSYRYIRDNSIRIVKAGSITGIEHANTTANWPTSDASASYGSTTDLWGTTWTAADINASNFGVAISAKGSSSSSSSSETAMIDHITITVTYTAGATCTAAAPTVTITPASQSITTNAGSVTYSVTIRNNDAGTGCSSVSYTLTPSDTNSTAFNASTLSSTSVSLAPGATSSPVTLTVSARSGQTTGTNTTTVTASATGHANGSSSVTTTLNVPTVCTANTPILQIAPAAKTVNTGGTANYTVTVINNDTAACAAATFTLSVVSDSNSANFNTPSTLTPINLLLNPGQSGTSTLAVSAKTTAVNNAANITTVRVTAPGHSSPSDVTATTTVSVATPGSSLLHNSTTTNSSKWASEGGWGVAGGKYGEFVCSTCHTEDTTNIKRVKQQITVPDTSKGNIPGSSVNFQSTSGPNSFGDDTGGHATSTKICEVCHSINKYHNYNTANNTGGLAHNNATDCMGCHPHSKAFKASESSGGADCSTCHSDIFNPMNSSTTTYHHYMATAAATYPNSATPADTDKRCLQCHADHNIFRPDLNTANTIGRAANLRVDATVVPVAGAPGTTYTNTDFVGAATNGGICVSCHRNTQTKNTTNQKSDGTTSTMVVTKTDFSGSAHNYTVTSTFANGNSQFLADCAKCHNAMNGQGLSFQSSTNKFGTHDSVNNRLLGALGGALTENYEEQFCYRCHSGTGPNDYYNVRAMSAASRDVQAQFSKANKHNVAGYSGLHKPTETLAQISAAKHVECGDCHNPHAAQAGNHTPGSSTMANVLKGATGVQVTWNSVNWTAPTYTGSTAQLPAATAEYQICFKCHSSANANYASWGGTGAAAWTNLGLEFSPNNRSGHPVVAGLSSYPNSLAPKALTAAQMSAPWTAVGKQRMTCSDCHDSDSTTSAGPHGSAVKWMLSGTNKAWPYTSASSNGTSTGTFFTLNTYDTGQGTTNGLFCLNCHPLNTTGSSSGWLNNVHTRSNHNDYPCVNCHIRVPHGGKVSRLITTDTAGLPGRYRPNGAGGAFTTGRVTAFIKASGPNNYSEDNCSQTGCGDHRTTITGETW